jgi:antibiotic biosynthesis monooxygenase (ABM) superfamily enzyme
MEAMTINAETMETSIIDIPREGALRQMQEAVEGYIECVTLDGFEMWVNEEGKLRGLPVNEVATALWESVYGATDVIVGNVLITGMADDEGYCTPLSAESISLIQKITDVLREVYA